MSLSPNLSLHNGAAMPAIGFGTWGLKPTDVDTALRAAVETGYRLFDLAPVYNNQREVGATLAAMQAEGRVRRQELFLTSKVPPVSACDGLEESARQTLRDLRTPYLDLFLVHWPFCVRGGSPTWPPPMSYQLGYSAGQLRETWRAMERLQTAGLVRAIGLSNIGPRRLQTLLRSPDLQVAPAVVQARCHPPRHCNARPPPQQQRSPQQPPEAEATHAPPKHRAWFHHLPPPVLLPGRATPVQHARRPPPRLRVRLAPHRPHRLRLIGLRHPPHKVPGRGQLAESAVHPA